ncbi:hypothetical protein BaRGS_00002700 [Batillaria attramentaria]|uniref:Uncharacterized protein n=1 Tax=Batillaria attramentaria TaxID=370345 RepID=A0ABD0M3P0_9CAEN
MIRVSFGLGTQCSTELTARTSMELSDHTSTAVVQLTPLRYRRLDYPDYPRPSKRTNTYYCSQYLLVSLSQSCAVFECSDVPVSGDLRALETAVNIRQLNAEYCHQLHLNLKPEVTASASQSV